LTKEAATCFGFVIFTEHDGFADLHAKPQRTNLQPAKAFALSVSLRPFATESVQRGGQLMPATLLT
jgi:hypothetical protein